MLYTKRVEFILQELQLGKSVKVADLSKTLQVSVDTIRRDLKALEQEGLIKYVRGGACLPDSMLSFSNFTGREIVNAQLKREASRKALAYIKEGDIVAINSGTTNTVLAQELAGLNKRFTVVTNNYAALTILMQNPLIKLISIGGDVDGLERSSYGAQCVREFDEYIPDIAFLSINAVNALDGFTDFRLNEIPIIKLLAKNSKRVIAVMDSSKFNKISKRKVLALDDVDILITDSQAKHLETFIKEGLNVK
ncbi:DeoR/GlpR family DNA-binding transcription regulator [Succinatimonas hippei]|uniref:Transcriptional regulator, DeoR family n=1 Tax=Succinatimonas hippei (strain DSM 22608 / JCM 16073 / KCTC 15190 / YIT 12066) TaxID=762983 RepID=E8LK79_SUCHY|nr:DeoR/GlpR family DNA-binding transcription regulator [Succinatimonas hippei]EFY07076.1 transcriptional regulator, DeoR family [Succinatimonas hippei YIT 12066]MCL1602594.1 DeoR/GlpR family DNA-binding transcription regulator [Succinatimonas hippei]